MSRFGILILLCSFLPTLSTPARGESQTLLPVQAPNVCRIQFANKTPNPMAEEIQRAQTLMLANISPSGTPAGTVTAAGSPTRTDYAFSWDRDAALTMATILGFAEESPTNARFYDPYLFSYVAFVQRQQLEPSLSGLGEPKFNLDGTAYNGEWPRPQNDGPALRALSVIGITNYLLNGGDEGLVQRMFYDSQLPSQSVIKRDLEYVAQNWQKPCFGLWEETFGLHFYTLAVERGALLNGSDLASALGDSGAAEYYHEQAAQIHALLDQFWDETDGYIIAMKDGSIKSKLDVSVILAALHGGLASDAPFGVTDPRILATAEKLKEAFRLEYPINQLPQFQNLGVAIGRHLDDGYDGYNLDSEGNPWFLATAAFAELYYRNAQVYHTNGKILINDINRAFFASLDPQVAQSSGELVLESNNIQFKRIQNALIKRGDETMARIRYHMDDSGHLSEQFNRSTGFMQGAPNLTWSYAAFITAAKSRPSWAAPLDPPY